MELAPFAGVRGCQGFTGPYPSAFLDKHYVKNCCAKVKERLILPKIIVQSSLNINRFGEKIQVEKFTGLQVHEFAGLRVHELV